MCTIGEFLELKELVALQLVSRHFYNFVVPKMRVKLEMPCLFLVLESARKKISIGFWRDNCRECA